MLVLALLWPAVARGQAILTPNQFVVSTRFTNVEPAIRAHVDPAGAYLTTLHARSEGMASPLTASSSVSSTRREADGVELTVDTTLAGIAYRVECRSRGRSSYQFAPVTASILPEPAPDVHLDLRECAGMLRIRVPASVTGGDVVAWRDGEQVFGSDDSQAFANFVPGEPNQELLLRGDGHLYHVRVRFRTGTDDFMDTLRFERVFDVVVGCDQVVEQDCSGGTGLDPWSSGTVTGLFDVVGEREVPSVFSNPENDSTKLRLIFGPWGNHRYGSITSDPASGSFVLRNVMPSGVVEPPDSYALHVSAWLRGGNDAKLVRLPPLEVLVPEAGTVDVGSTMVVSPGYAEGEIQLAGPPPRGPFGSVLQHLMPSATSWAPGDRLPAGGFDFSYVSASGSSRVASGASRSTLAGSSDAALAGAFSPDTFDYVAPYELVLPSLNGEAGIWRPGNLTLQVTGDSADPSSHADCRTVISEPPASEIEVAPFERVVKDCRYCVSEVNLAFVATSGLFCDPLIPYDAGHFSGRDFLGRERDYGVYVTATGTPIGTAAAAARGSVRMALPAGEYVFRPRVTAINPDGSTSSTQVLPVPLTVGCRQVIDLTPEIGIRIGVDDVPPCAEGGLLHVSGSVRSDEPVRSLTWSVSGSPPVTICADCGTSPTFDAAVPLADANNEIVIEAIDVSGRHASVTAYTRWAREPSALDRRPGSPPLRVARSRVQPDGLRLTWEAGGAASVYRGTIAALHSGTYDHAGFGACRVTDALLEVPPAAGNWYFLATGTCEWGDGSTGRDSRGNERPAARDRCP